jgi:hypothetical protein
MGSITLRPAKIVCLNLAIGCTALPGWFSATGSVHAARQNVEFFDHLQAERQSVASIVLWGTNRRDSVKLTRGPVALHPRERRAAAGENRA